MLVQFLWTFLFRRSGKDDEGGVEDEATWDWQSVVVPASPDRVSCPFYSSKWLINSFPQSQQAVIYPQLTKNVEALSKRPLLANILMGCSYNPGIILMEYSYNPGASLFLQPNLPSCKCPRL